MRRAAALLLAFVLAPVVPVGSAGEETARVRASPAYDADGNRVFDDLDARLASAPPTDAIETIVVFTGAMLAQGLAAVRHAAPDARVIFEYPTLPGAALALRPADVRRVAALDVTRQVEANVEGTPELSTSTHYLGVRHVWNDLGVTGNADGNPSAFSKDDATIAVLDTGIHAAHADFAGGKLIAWHDTVSGSAVPSDSSGHGTHVASIATGLGNGDPLKKGVAPGASLVLVRISTKAHAAAAVEWVKANKDRFGIDVMTMSFGFGTGRDGSDSLSLLFDSAFDAGIVTVKSTGNSGPELGTMTIPADAKKILAVGSLVDPGKGGWKLASYSSRGPTTDGRVKPDLAAPGDGISAAARGTTSGYLSLSGTSMAAPHVAGVAALVKAANPSLTATEIRQILLDTAEERGVPGPDDEYGYGVVDAFAAVQKARGLTGTNPVRSPSVFSMSDSLAAPDAWTLRVENGAHRVSVTTLTEAPMGAERSYRVTFARVPDANSGSWVQQVHVNQNERHATFDLPTPTAGVYAVTVQGASTARFAIDVSAEFPLDPPAWHGTRTPATPPVPPRVPA